jgi:hypothetical protein
LLLAPFAACSAPETVGSAEQNDTASDLATATQILNLLNGPTGTCNLCHDAGPDKVRAWGAAMQAIDSACFNAARLTPSQQVDCLRDPTTPGGSGFTPHKLGLYAAGATFPQFSNLFQSAFPAATWQAQFATFTGQAKMPISGLGLTPQQFALVKGWVLRGMPQLDQAAGGTDAGADADANNQTGCTDSVSPDLVAHIASMKTGGWGAKLADLSTPMFGCGGATSALSCLTALPDLTSKLGAPGVQQTVRQLRITGLTSHWWVRSSADGRYVGFGQDPASSIIDLTTPAGTAPIAVSAPYDPFFFPGNDGFAFAGVNNTSIVACKQSLLSDLAGTPNPQVTFNDPRCATVGQDVYESIGASLDGVRYFVTTGAHENDDGGNDITHSQFPNFGPNATTTFVPMVNNGLSYRAQTPVSLVIPGEGDLLLSPSSLLAVARFAKGSAQGYHVHMVQATQSSPTSPFSIQVPIGAEVCMRGAKPSVSFDERFIAAHQYVDTTDPGNGGLPDGSSNIVLADLKTGKKTRLTTMGANQYALYPHFRADGWIYFLIRDRGTGKESMMASDAAIRITSAIP